MIRFCFVLAMLGLLGLSASAQNDTATKTFTYRKTKEADLSLVVHYPRDWKASDRRPAMIYFFGGGWTGGTTEQFTSQAKHFADRGMVTVRADYRVKSRHGVTPDQCVEDARSAVRWLREHASELGIDPEKIVSSGGSAGGHLAACTYFAEGQDAPGDNLKISCKPNVLLLYNPVLKFTGVAKLEERLKDPAIAKRISPTLHLTKNAPPTLLFFGSADALKAQGDEFQAKGKELGVRVESYIADGVGHGFFNKEPWLSKTTQRAEEFLTSLGYVGKK